MDSYWRFKQAREQESQKMVGSLLQALQQRAQLQELARQREEAQRQQQAKVQALSEERMIQDAIARRDMAANLIPGLAESLQGDPATAAQAGEALSAFSQALNTPIASVKDVRNFDRQFQDNVAPFLMGTPGFSGATDVTVGYGEEGRAARPPATVAPPNVGLPQGRGIPTPGVRAFGRGRTPAAGLSAQAAGDVAARNEKRSQLDAIIARQQGIEDEERRRGYVLSDSAVGRAIEQLAIVQDTGRRQPEREVAAGILRGIVNMGMFPEEYGWLDAEAQAALEEVDPLTAAAGDADLAEAKAREALAPLRVEGQVLSNRQTSVGIDQAIERGELEAEEAFVTTGRGFDRLTDEQKANLRETLDLPAGVGLQQWGQVRFGQFFQNMRNEERYSAIQVQQGNQQIEMNAQTMDRNEWLAAREQSLAVRDDAQFYVDNIANAVRHGTPNVIESYLEAYEDPESEIGAQLRELFPEKVKLQQNLRDARETQDLGMQELRISVEAQETAHANALLQLNQGRYLDPYFREAMRLQYERDGQQAVLDVQNFAFKDFTTKVTALGEMAQVVEPSFWDNLPGPLADALEGTELGLGGFRAISRTAEFMRQEPARQEAWQNFQFLAEAAPEEGRKPDVLLAADEYLTQMGIDDPAGRQAMLDVLQATWKHKDASLNQLLASTARMLAKDSGDITEDEIKDLNTVSDNLRSGLDAQANRISTGGCGYAVESRGGLMLLPNNEAETDTVSGDPCSVVMERYYDRVEEYDRTTQKLLTTVEARHGLDLSNPDSVPPGGQTAPGGATPVGMGYTALQPIVGRLNEPQRNLVMNFVSAYENLNQYVNPNTGQIERSPEAIAAAERLSNLQNQVRPILGNDYGRVQTIIQRGRDSNGSQ